MFKVENLKCLEGVDISTCSKEIIRLANETLGYIFFDPCISMSANKQSKRFTDSYNKLSEFIRIEQHVKHQ